MTAPPPENRPVPKTVLSDLRTRWQSTAVSSSGKMHGNEDMMGAHAERVGATAAATAGTHAEHAGATAVATACMYRLVHSNQSGIIQL